MIQSLARGMEILELLSEERSMGVKDLAALLAVNKSTAFRLLDTLRDYNLVEQDDATGKYKLGIGILRISEAMLGGMDILEISKPYLRKLAEVTRENAHICVLSNNKAMVLDQVKSAGIYKVYVQIGMEEPMHSSAVGKCLLAYRSDVQIQRIVKKLTLTAFTPRTITDPNALLSDLKRIREQGYVIDDEENIMGVRCIAAPIVNHRGEVNACIGISGPSTSITHENIDKITAMVKKVGDMISARMGGKGATSPAEKRKRLADKTNAIREER